MPKKVRAASGQIVGGHGARRLPGDTTPSGCARSAGRWTSPAAIGAQQQLLHTFNAAPPATYKTQALANASVLASDPVRSAVIPRHRPPFAEKTQGWFGTDTCP